MFFAEISHTFPSYFLELSAKIKNTLVFHIFINNSRSKENKKNLEHSFVKIINSKRVQNFSKKY